MSNISENMFLAIDTIISKRLQSLQFDKTEVCTIIEVKDNNEYVVSNGSAKYSVKSAEIYKEKDQVYVLIPNGEYSGEKVILSKYIASEDTSFNIVRPFDKFIDLDTNVITLAEPVSVQANGSRTTPAKIKISNLDKLDERAELSGYTRMGIKAKFKTLLPQGVNEGKYGIYIKFRVGQRVKQTEDEKIDYDIFYHQYEFTFDDIIGNPYGFVNGSEQEAVFDISELKQENGNPIILEDMEVYLFEDNNFKINGKKLSYQASEATFKNIILEDLRISFGYSTDEPQFKNGTGSYIFPIENLFYNAASTVNKEKKNIGLRWIYNKKVYRTIEEFKNKEDFTGNIQIRWYKYERGQIAADEYCGLEWVSLGEEYFNKFESDFIPNSELNVNRIKAIVILTSTQEQDNKGKSIGIDTKYTSNELIFVNSDNISDMIQTAKLTALTIIPDDGFNGNYFLYNTMHELTDNSLYQQDRTLSLAFDTSKITGIEGSVTSLSGVEYVEFFMPVKNTMINFQGISEIENGRKKYKYNKTEKKWDYSLGSLNGKVTSLPDKRYIYIPELGCKLTQDDETNYGYYTYDGNSKIYRRNPDGKFNEDLSVAQYVRYIDKGEWVYVKVTEAVLESDPIYYGVLENEYRVKIDSNGNDDWKPQLTYRINKKYYPKNSNNTIRAVARYNDNDYAAALDMLFGAYGTVGTEYTLVIDVPNDNKKYLSINGGGKNTTQLQLYLIDSKGQDVTSQINSDDITWYYEFYDNIGGNKEVQLDDKFTFENNKTSIIIDLSATGGNGEGKLWVDFDYQVPIFKAQVKWSGLIFEAKYALPIVNFGDNDFSEDVNPHIYSNFNPQIRYDTSGTPYDYINEALFLKQEYLTNASYVWSIEWEDLGTPELYDTNTKIRPQKTYIEGSNIAYLKCVVTGKAKDGNTRSFTWKQAFIISQNIYPSGIVNDWDGKLVVNDDKQYIASPKIVAGKKDKNNTFTGVVLGEWSDDTTVLGNGIYGFGQGVMRYSLDDKGNVEFKHSNGGKIIMNDQDFILQSGEYEEKISGMKIDLKDGSMELNGSITWGSKAKPDYTLDQKYENTIIDSGKVYSPYLMGQNLFLLTGADLNMAKTFEIDEGHDLGFHLMGYYKDEALIGKWLEYFALHPIFSGNTEGGQAFSVLEVISECDKITFNPPIVFTKILMGDTDVLQITNDGIKLSVDTASIHGTLKVEKITDFYGNPIGGTAVFA